MIEHNNEFGFLTWSKNHTLYISEGAKKCLQLEQSHPVDLPSIFEHAFSQSSSPLTEMLEWNFSNDESKFYHQQTMLRIKKSDSISDVCFKIHYHSEYIFVFTETIHKSLNQRFDEHSAQMSLLGQLTFFIMHEINNPLMCINLYVEKMKKKALRLTGSSLNLNEELSCISKLTSKIALIIQSMSYFKKNDSSKNWQLININHIVQESLEMINPKIKHHRVMLHQDLKSEQLISCQSTQIFQIILNLMMNAIQAVENLNDKWIKIETFDEDNNAVFIITDNGSGILPENKNHLFSAHFTTKPNGSGVGLYLSQRMAQNNGGNLSLNTASKSTQFKLTIPIKTT